MLDLNVLGLASQNLTVCYLLHANGRIYEGAEITVVIVDLFFSKCRPINISVHIIFQIFLIDLKGCNSFSEGS